MRGTYTRGDRFILDNDSKGEEYILAALDNNYVTLISLKDGNRWFLSQQVKDVFHISKAEFSKISDGSDFTKLEEAY